ncbi:hypothetical protein HN924_03130 [Candidatus Woesearchaeota archaeon]|jgi:hypothetical protein|nr:hypothetical protein [Candidatus Woesearchaeota archaeon]MBT7062935.1 hypothetical protein [Candidatus Woesearchaeota archaeon]MBT7402643.1 hypothetical protein [Candidatus Woesearchaeota archaeon]
MKFIKIIKSKDFQLVTLFVLFDLIITNIGIIFGYGQEGHLIARMFTNNFTGMFLLMILCLIILLFLFSILKGLLRQIYASFQIGASVVGIISWITQILFVIPDNFGPSLASIFVVWSSTGILVALFTFVLFEKKGWKY